MSTRTECGRSHTSGRCRLTLCVAVPALSLLLASCAAVLTDYSPVVSVGPGTYQIAGDAPPIVSADVIETNLVQKADAWCGQQGRSAQVVSADAQSGRTGDLALANANDQSASAGAYASQSAFGASAAASARSQAFGYHSEFVHPAMRGSAVVQFKCD